MAWHLLVSERRAQLPLHGPPLSHSGGMACTRRAVGLLAACARRAVGSDAAAPRGARLLSVEAKAGEPGAAAAAAAARFLEAAKLKAHADKFKSLDEVLAKKRRELKEAGLTPKEARRRAVHVAARAALTLRLTRPRRVRSASG